MKAQPHSCYSTQKRRGFALIATISMLLLLTVIAVAFLSLSTLTVKSARTDWALEEARANARLALMIAIGELQRDLGPDRRVSANAAILDGDKDTVTIDNVDQPYWVGVWSTDFKDEANSNANVVGPWVRDDSRGGLRTLRGPDWDTEENVQNYLVSGNEGGKRIGNQRFLSAKERSVSELDENEKLRLVTENSVSESEQEVTVKRVITQKYVRTANGRRSPVESGSYGYWVGDLGVRANISVADAHTGKSPNIGTEEGFERSFNTQDYEMGVVEGFNTTNPEIAPKLVSPSSLEFTGVSKDDLRKNFHNITSASQSVMSNTRDGGLQKDLDAYIKLSNSKDGIDDLNRSGEIHYMGIKDDDQVVGVINGKEATIIGAEGPNRFELTAPRFRIFRNWIEDAKSAGFSLSSPSVDLKNRNRELLPKRTVMEVGEHTVFDGLLGGFNDEDDAGVRAGFTSVKHGGPKTGSSVENYPMQIKELTYPSMSPIVVDASIYYNIAQVELERSTGGGESEPVYQLYMCTYPRVALWNPYNVSMRLPPMIIQLFVNGNKKVRMQFADRSADISIPFGKRYGGFDAYDGEGNLTREQKILDFNGGLGQCFYFLDRNGRGTSSVTIPPGQTVVFTPDPDRSKRARDGGRAGDYSSSNFVNNLLTPQNRPDVKRFFFEEIAKGTHDGGVGRDGSSFRRNNTLVTKRALSYRETATRADKGADNAQFMLKYFPGRRFPENVALKEFSEDLELVTYSNCSLQLGGSDETPLRLTGTPGAVHTMSRGPNIRSLRPAAGGGDDELTPQDWTRDGYRLRWFEETSTNLSKAGSLSELDVERLFQTAPIANWNMRMSFNTRNPMDNITSRPPYYFGIYTRDLPNEQVGFDALEPVSGAGRTQLGFPFGPPSSAPSPEVILFEVPTSKIGIPSLAYLRNMKLSELAWHPTYPIANSLADPKILPEMTTIDRSQSPFRNNKGPFNSRTIGYHKDRDSGQGPDYWSSLLREALQDNGGPGSNHVVQGHVVYDMSFEANYNLWDTFFLSTGTGNEKDNFVKKPEINRLPNGLFRAYGDQQNLKESLTGDESFFKAASQLMLKGGFNVNSTSVEAWKALLASSKGVNGGRNDVVFPRFLNPRGRENTSGSLPEDPDVYTGNRSLDDEEIDELARAIVAEVKKRAPFLGLADFVNRRLYPVGPNPQEEILEQARAGAIEEALFKSGVNNGLTSGIGSFPVKITRETGDIGDSSFDRIADATRLDHRLKPPSKLWGMPGYLTQGDVLGVIGSSLRARSDTFVVRAYGDAKSANGKVLARAWCEATVQRTPEPVNPDEEGLNPESVSDDAVDFGRRFRIVGFRWMNKEEV